ncbi:MAG: FAD:protein FMN transferase [Salibacteraceae bacterium]
MNTSRFFTAIIGLILLFSACQNTPEKVNTGYLHIRGAAQGTSYSIKYKDPTGRNIRAALDSIYAEMDQSISNYKAGSLIQQVNDADSMHKIDHHFLTMLQRSQWAYELSEGAFDPTIWPLMQFWGFGGEGIKEVDSIDSVALDSVLQMVGFNKVRLFDGKRQLSIREAMYSSYRPDYWTILKDHPDLQLDFNALGQGYTVDIIAAYLDGLTITDYMIELGGEVRVKGKNPFGNPWTTGIVKPVEDKLAKDQMAVLPLDNQSITTSGNYRKFYQKDGQKVAHTINPKTGSTSQHNLLSATVVAPDCTMADALSTVCMVLGMEKARELVEPIEGVSLFLVYAEEDGSMATYTSPEIEGSLKIETDVQ